MLCCAVLLQEQLMSSPDLGHDLTSVNLLLTKHRANEDEIAARGQRLEGVKAEGNALIEADSFGAEKIQGECRLVMCADRFDILCSCVLRGVIVSSNMCWDV